MTESQTRGILKHNMKPNKKELARFRAITASIIIAIVSRFAPISFRNAHHTTMLDISSPDWLDIMCKLIDNGGSVGFSIPLNPLVEALASVYTAHDPEKGERTNPRVIAWRNGIYGIVPSVLLNMKVSADRFDLVCIDYFWANVKVREDGSIRTGFHPTVDRHEIDLHHLGANSSTL